MNLPAAKLSTDCVCWTGAQSSKGYGQVRHNGRVEYVHRLAWIEANGPIPDGMTVEHSCRVRCCLNVRHMELVTRPENSRRAAPHRLARAG